MKANKEMTSGLLMTAAGVGIVVFAVFLVGLATGGGALDVVSIVTAAAGVVMGGTGVYTMWRSVGTRRFGT
jgi:hypothetical protein